MKLNELKQPTKEALDWSPLIGHYGQSFMGDKPAGVDREGQMAKNIFVRNFLQKAISGLDAAINSGLVDPNAALSGVAPKTPAQTEPETPAQAAERVRKEKQNKAASAAQSNMASNLKPSTPAQTTNKKWTGSGPRNSELAAKMKRTGYNESSMFLKLNYILESIINVDEEVASKQSVSQYIQSVFKDYMKNVPISDPNTFTQIKALADQVQATYSKDKGKSALTKLADLGWAVSHSPEAMAKRGKSSTSSEPASTTAPATAAPATAAPATAAAEPVVSPEAATASKVGVRQINKIIPTLRKRDLLSVKKNVDNTLNSREGGTASSTTAPADAGASAFGQMANTLSGANASKSSTGGTTTKTPTGLVHTAKPQAAATAAPEKDNIISMPKGRTGRVRASREGGVTPEEQAKFDEKVRQAMANQK